MTKLRIRLFKGGAEQPETTITIPGEVLAIASKLIPKQTAAALQDKDIDIEELIKLSSNPDVQGTLVEIEEHKKDEKIIISLEQ